MVVGPIAIDSIGITDGLLVILFSHDKRLAQTRHWVLEQAGIRLLTVHTLTELYAAADRTHVSAFLLCNSLPAELSAEAAQQIRQRWKNAKLMIFVPSSPVPEVPADVYFPAMQGPGHMVQMVRRLLAP